MSSTITTAQARARIGQDSATGPGPVELDDDSSSPVDRIEKARRQGVWKGRSVHVAVNPLPAPQRYNLGLIVGAANVWLLLARLFSWLSIERHVSHVPEP